MRVPGSGRVNVSYRLKEDGSVIPAVVHSEDHALGHAGSARRRQEAVKT